MGIWQYLASEFSGGTGAVDNPYIIETPNQLAKIGQYGFTSGYYKIIKDIDLSGNEWLCSSFALSGQMFIYGDKQIGGITIKNMVGSSLLMSDSISGYSLSVENITFENALVNRSYFDSGVRGDKGIIISRFNDPIYMANIEINKCIIETQYELGSGDEGIGFLVGKTGQYMTLEKIEVRNSSIKINNISNNYMTIYCGGILGYSSAYSSSGPDGSFGLNGFVIDNISCEGDKFYNYPTIFCGYNSNSFTIKNGYVNSNGKTFDFTNITSSNYYLNMNSVAFNKDSSYYREPPDVGQYGQDLFNTKDMERVNNIIGSPFVYGKDHPSPLVQKYTWYERSSKSFYSNGTVEVSEPSDFYSIIKSLKDVIYDVTISLQNNLDFKGAYWIPLQSASSIKINGNGYSIKGIEVFGNGQGYISNNFYGSESEKVCILNSPSVSSRYPITELRNLTLRATINMNQSVVESDNFYTYQEISAFSGYSINVNESIIDIKQNIYIKGRYSNKIGILESNRMEISNSGFRDKIALWTAEGISPLNTMVVPFIDNGSDIVRITSVWVSCYCDNKEINYQYPVTEYPYYSSGVYYDKDVAGFQSDTANAVIGLSTVDMTKLDKMSGLSTGLWEENIGVSYPVLNNLIESPPVINYSTKIQIKRGDTESLEWNNLLLDFGQPCVEFLQDGGIRLKVGDGFKEWNDLVYIDNVSISDEFGDFSGRDVQVLSDGEEVYPITKALNVYLNNKDSVEDVVLSLKDNVEIVLDQMGKIVQGVVYGSNNWSKDRENLAIGANLNTSTLILKGDFEYSPTSNASSEIVFFNKTNSTTSNFFNLIGDECNVSVYATTSLSSPLKLINISYSSSRQVNVRGFTFRATGYGSSATSRIISDANGLIYVVSSDAKISDISFKNLRITSNTSQALRLITVKPYTNQIPTNIYTNSYFSSNIIVDDIKFERCTIAPTLPSSANGDYVLIEIGNSNNTSNRIMPGNIEIKNISGSLYFYGSSMASPISFFNISQPAYQNKINGISLSYNSSSAIDVKFLKSIYNGLYHSAIIKNTIVTDTSSTTKFDYTIPLNNVIFTDNIFTYTSGSSSAEISAVFSGNNCIIKDNNLTTYGKLVSNGENCRVKDNIVGQMSVNNSEINNLDDSGWKDLTLQNGFIKYQSNNSYGIKIRKFHLGGGFYLCEADVLISPPASNTIGSASATVIASLPDASWIPEMAVTEIMQGSGKDFWTFHINVNGLQASRYRNETGYVTPASSAWMNGRAFWISKMPVG